MKRFYETFVKGPTPKEEITNFVDGFFCAVRKGEPKTAVFFGENQSTHGDVVGWLIFVVPILQNFP